MVTKLPVIVPPTGAIKALRARLQSRNKGSKLPVIVPPIRRITRRVTKKTTTRVITRRHVRFTGFSSVRVPVIRSPSVVRNVFFFRRSALRARNHAYGELRAWNMLLAKLGFRSSSARKAWLKVNKWAQKTFQALARRRGVKLAWLRRLARWARVHRFHNNLKSYKSQIRSAISRRNGALKASRVYWRKQRLASRAKGALAYGFKVRQGALYRAYSYGVRHASKVVYGWSTFRHVLGGLRRALRAYRKQFLVYHKWGTKNHMAVYGQGYYKQFAKGSAAQRGFAANLVRQTPKFRALGKDLNRWRSLLSGAKQLRSVRAALYYRRLVRLAKQVPGMRYVRGRGFLAHAVSRFRRAARIFTRYVVRSRRFRRSTARQYGRRFINTTRIFLRSRANVHRANYYAARMAFRGRLSRATAYGKRMYSLTVRRWRQIRVLRTRVASYRRTLAITKTRYAKYVSWARRTLASRTKYYRSKVASYNRHIRGLRTTLGRWQASARKWAAYGSKWRKISGSRWAVIKQLRSRVSYYLRVIRVTRKSFANYRAVATRTRILRAKIFNAARRRLVSLINVWRARYYKMRASRNSWTKYARYHQGLAIRRHASIKRLSSRLAHVKRVIRVRKATFASYRRVTQANTRRRLASFNARLASMRRYLASRRATLRRSRALSAKRLTELRRSNGVNRSIVLRHAAARRKRASMVSSNIRYVDTLRAAILRARRASWSHLSWLYKQAGAARVQVHRVILVK